MNCTRFWDVTPWILAEIKAVKINIFWNNTTKKREKARDRMATSETVKWTDLLMESLNIHCDRVMFCLPRPATIDLK
jgi:hypothetical protein